MQRYKEMYGNIALLGLVKAAWLALAVLILLLLVRATPVYLEERMQLCTASPTQCSQDALMDADRLRQFEAMGISNQDWAVYMLVTRLILTALFFLAALVIILRKPSERMAVFVAFFLLTFNGNSGVINALGQVSEAWAFATQILTAVAWVSFLLFFTLFPSGHFAPRWVCWVVLTYAVLLLSSLFFRGTFLDFGTLLPWFGMIYFPSLFAVMLAVQVYRYRSVSTPTQRFQTKWVVYGISMMLTLTLVFSLPMIFSPAYIQSTFFFILAGGLGNVVLLLLPLSIVMAMVRSHLWEIDILINRSLVYGTMTLGVGTMYVLLVGTLSNMFREQDSLWISLLVTGLIAVLFHPIREQLQQGVNRLMHGQRDEPYTVLSRLGRRLETTLAPDAVLPVLVETIAQSLKLPYAAIRLGSGESQALAAAYHAHPEKGKPVGDLILFPILHQGQVLGELMITPREPGEALTEPDRHLLADLARQAGTAIHAVRLTIDLQHAREQLVLALEEERRRLRRDLHDGLGPSLANIVMLTETARDVYPLNNAQAEDLLNKAVRQAQSAIDDVRRLVYNLRPPALDELGLVGALREQITGYEHTGILFHFDAPEMLPLLPAAVEVAAYRITQEAINNVVKHAQARECFISLCMADRLEINIHDNGAGVSADHRTGIGLFSMCERAAELGGVCKIHPLNPGTRVQVLLPV